MSLIATRIMTVRIQLEHENMAEEHEKTTPSWGELITSSNTSFVNEKGNPYIGTICKHIEASETEETPKETGLSYSKPEMVRCESSGEQLAVVVVRCSYTIKILPLQHKNHELKIQEEFKRQLLDNECRFVGILSIVYEDLIRYAKDQFKGFTPTLYNVGIIDVHRPSFVIGYKTERFDWSIQRTPIVGIPVDVVSSFGNNANGQPKEAYNFTYCFAISIKHNG